MSIVPRQSAYPWALWSVLLLALALRLGYSLGVAHAWLHVQPELESTDEYHLIARNLLEGNGYRFRVTDPLTVLRPPGYPTFLLAVFALAGVNYVWVQIAQALLGVLSCWLLFLLGRWILSEELGLVAATLGAIYPNSIEYSARLYCENLYIPLFIGFSYLLCRASIEGSPRRGLAAGAVWGAALLTRGTLLSLPLALPFGILLSRTHRSPPSRWLRWSVPAALASILVVAPWITRNYALTGAFVPSSSMAWQAIYRGNQVSKRMSLRRWDDLSSADSAAAKQISEAQAQRSDDADGAQAPGTPGGSVRHDRIARELVLADWRSDPAGFIERSLAGLGFAWFFTFGPRMRLVSLATHLPLFVLFVMGAVHMARSQRDAFVRAWPALGLILFVNVFMAFAWPHVRYMAPAIMLSFVFSALPLLWLWHRMFVPGHSRGEGAAAMPLTSASGSGSDLVPSESD